MSESESASEHSQRASGSDWIAVAWIVGYALFFFHFTLPNSNPPVSRVDVWWELPELLWSNVVTPAKAVTSSWSNLLQRLDLFAVAAAIWLGSWAVGGLLLRALRISLADGSVERLVCACGVGVGYDGNTTGAGNVNWLSPFTGALMVNSIAGVNFAVPGGSPVLVDDPDELTTDSKYLQRPYDEPLDAKDILFLFMSPSDRARVGATSRFQDLMPGNITPNTTNFYQLEVARRLTSESWDVKSFALPRFLGGSGTDAKPGVAGTDDNGDGNVDDINELGWPGSDDDRAWEYNVDLDGNGKWEFPPQFLGGTGNEQAYQPNDPFRPQLRRLLTVEYGNTTSIRDAMRLSINEFLDVEHRPNSTSTHRAIFIVDRSVVEEAYDKGSGTFDWKKLLLAKQRIN